MRAVVEQTIRAFGRIDILVNGAAGNFLASTEHLSINALKTVFEIDALGTFIATKACLDALKATRGNILNISATMHYTQVPYQVECVKGLSKIGFKKILFCKVARIDCKSWRRRHDASLGR